MLEALERAGAGTSLAEPAARHRGRPDVDALAAALEAREEPVVLVLDDFHEVAEAVAADVDRLLQHPPEALRLVIATRADPPLPVARLRARGELVEVRAADLRFTHSEAGVASP